MPSATVENYLKQIYLLSQEEAGGRVGMGQLSRRMEVVPGTATSMVKAMHRESLVEYAPRAGVELTASGEEEALRVLRKHRIVEMFLVEVLGLDWAEVHAEAELLEHALTQKLVDRMDAYLGYPEEDPHGDPIPTATGRIRERATVLLSEVRPGKRACIAQILQQDKAFLNFMHMRGLTPGTRLTVLAQESMADLVEVELENGTRQALGGAAAARVRVSVTG